MVQELGAAQELGGRGLPVGGSPWRGRSQGLPAGSGPQYYMFCPPPSAPAASLRLPQAEAGRQRGGGWRGPRRTLAPAPASTSQRL